MKKSHLFLILLIPFAYLLPQLAVDAAPSGHLMKYLSSFVKWTRAASSSPKTPQNEGNVVQFENGYLVETVVEGNKLGVEPYSIRVSQEGELFAVDSVNSNIVRITPPLSQYSRARLVAGSFQGYSGHVDGKPSDARFSHPKGVTMDDKGNVYVADTVNLAIRKIGDSGVTTIAGGKSNVAGYRDGPSEDAKFSNDFDVVYEGRTCSLLIVDRGNAAIRQISLQQEDCNYQSTSISASDVLMVMGAVLVGYVSCVLHNGFGPSLSSMSKKIAEPEFQEKPTVDKPSTLHVESIKEDPIAGWPSFGRLVTDLSKQAFEGLGSVFLSFVPSNPWPCGSKQGLTPIKDSLIMPEDEQNPPMVQKQRTSSRAEAQVENRGEIPQVLKQRISSHTEAHTETRGDTYTQQVPSTTTNTYTQQKSSKIRSSSFRDPSSLAKHRSSSKRHDYSEFYGSAEAPQSNQFSASKSQKERTRHRHRDKAGEVFGAAAGESKPVEINSVDYGDPKFDHYNIRRKYAAEDHLFRL